MVRYFPLGALAVLLASPTLPGAAQSNPGFGQPRLAYNLPAAEPVVQVPAWSRQAARELLSYVEGIGREGLEPAAYGPDRLRAAIDAGDEAALTGIASEIFYRLTADLSGGYVRGGDRVAWHLPSTGINGHDQNRLLGQVMRAGGVGAALDSLLPTHSQYVGLRNALAATPESDRARRDLIRANMERWRWMPRDLGRRHIIVNVPAFTAALVEDGRVVSRHRVIVGKTSTPTPQLSAMATGVTFNPWWTVPQSIIRTMRSFNGYQVRQGDGFRIVRQPPGPNNSLGRIKVEMPNDHAIYLHDTPAQNLFGRDVRAFSAGCIRTQNIRELTELLLASNGQWDRAAIDRAIAAGDTRQVNFAQPIPVHIAYFTAAATDGGRLLTYADLYGRDARVRQALNRLGSGGVAAGN